MKVFKNTFMQSTLKLVMMRHGETQQNSVKQWSGWNEAKLSVTGAQQAVECARMIQEHNLKFDLCYSSMLSRSIKTLNIILSQMDCLYLPTLKRWQLNEKFYGALQGLDKLKMVQLYGKNIINEWRRSYVIAPPKIFQDDQRHPCNNKKYKDVNPDLLPNTQNLFDVYARVKGLYEAEIRAQLLSGKSILIVCHGSTIRAWNKILFQGQNSESSKLIVPNATPILFELDKDNLQVVDWKYLQREEVLNRKINLLQNELKN